MKQTNIYFPFTHISQKAQKTIFTFFDLVHCFASDLETAWKTPTGPAAENGNILLHFCDEQIMERVDSQFLQYQEWVKIHKGNERNLKSLLTDTPYYQDDTHVTAIKSQLKSSKQSSMNKVLEKENIDQHLLFLKMAGMCDALNENIDQELASLENTQSALFSTLRGVDEPASRPETGQIQPDPGEVMTAQCG